MCGSVAEWLGRWTFCEQQVASSNPGLSAVKCNPGQVVNTYVPPVTKQYNLVPANGRWCLVAGKVTVGLASYWPRITDISGSPSTGSRPRRGRWAPAYALLWSMVDFTFTSVQLRVLHLYKYWHTCSMHESCFSPVPSQSYWSVSHCHFLMHKHTHMNVFVKHRCNMYSRPSRQLTRLNKNKAQKIKSKIKHQRSPLKTDRTNSVNLTYTHTHTHTHTDQWWGLENIGLRTRLVWDQKNQSWSCTLWSWSCKFCVVLWNTILSCSSS